MRFIRYILPIFLLIFIGCEKAEVCKFNNDEKKPLQFKLGKVICPVCAMEINNKIDSAQVVLDDGKTYIFDDLGCMAEWIKNKDKKKLTIWVYASDIKKYIKANKAYYKLGYKTPMEHGFRAFSKKYKNSITFEQFLLKIYRAEDMTNPKIKAKYL